eukprot:1340514-Amorphochlora_amoeboformis.AAC.2
MSSRASLRLLVVSCGVLAAGFIGWLTWSYVASEKERKNKPKCGSIWFSVLLFPRVFTWEGRKENPKSFFPGG